MRFRRTYIQSNGKGPKPTPSPSAASRPGGRRKIFLFSFGLLALLGVLVNRAWLRADGIVAGELVSVSPIVQARLTNVLVHCLDHVTKGQRVAEFTNEVTVEAAEQQLQQLGLQLQQAASNVRVAEAQAAAAKKLVDAQHAMVLQLSAVFKAYDQLVNKQFVAMLAWENAKAAVARAQAEEAAAEFVYQTQLEQRDKAVQDADVLRKRIASFKDAPELTGHFFLAAPSDGIVTDCTAHVGEVIPARTPIFHLFDPQQAYAIVFFDPSDRARIAEGENIDLGIAGLPATVRGRVVGFYPELSGMPTALTRYFWQQERWSQYAPARVDFEGLDAAQRQSLGAWAQISASQWHWPAPFCVDCWKRFTLALREIGLTPDGGSRTGADASKEIEAHD
jgi:multidrug resistance efflux pump